MSLTLGLLYATGLQVGLRLFPHLRAVANKPPVRFVIRSQSGGNRVDTRAAGTLLDLTPIKVARPKLGEQLTRPSAAVPATAAPLVPATEKPPDMPVPAAVDIAPPVASGPPAPPDHEEQLKGRQYTEKPGGDTLVLALLVDQRGIVISTRIMVPSGYPMLDMTYKLAALGRNVGTPSPPLKDGDTMWADLAVHYSSTAVKLP